jgi:membrane-associated protein
MMDAVHFLVDVFLHLDRHLAEVVADYGTATYLLLFAIVFAETGFVFTPFLPGDSLIFAAGALSAGGALRGGLVFVLLAAAAILGDTVNYWIGNRLGAWLVARHSRLVRQEHLDRTHAFFEKYGGKTIIIARFVPIVRTCAPFVAGLGAMTYGKFLAYNVIGGLLWVVVCQGAGYFFGNLPVVREHFSLVVLAIVLISILPGVYGYIRSRRTARAKPVGAAAGAARPDLADPARPGGR